MGETIEQLFRRAMKNGMLDDLFAGRNGYVLPPGKTVDANVPTDYNLLFYWIHKSCRKEEIPVFQKAIKEAVRRLLDGSAEDVYFAYNACWSELFLEADKQAVLTICDDDFLRYVKKKCHDRKNELYACHAWEGLGRRGGLWNVMQESSDRLRIFYGVSIL